MTHRLTGQVSNRIRVAGHEIRVKKNSQVTLRTAEGYSCDVDKSYRDDLINSLINGETRGLWMGKV